MKKKNVVVLGEKIAIEDVVAVARHGAKVELSKSARDRISPTAKTVSVITAPPSACAYSCLTNK